LNAVTKSLVYVPACTLTVSPAFAAATAGAIVEYC
jgi:hypothetical protein